MTRRGIEALSAGVLMLAFSVAVRTQTPPVRQAWRAPAAPAQPLPYSHKQHVALGLRCHECHVNPDAGARMTFPPTATCMTCHSAITSTRASIAALKAFDASGEAIPWVRVYEMPDFVYWQHGTHLQANITCAECHGDVAAHDTTSQLTDVATMRGCLTCHEKRKILSDCGDCHEPMQ